jgi:hypothetical protein
MSIAQANFSNQARTRYGKDYYDERMQATRTVLVNTNITHHFGFYILLIQDQNHNRRSIKLDLFSVQAGAGC